MEARVLPSLEGYLEKTGQVPPCLSASSLFTWHFIKALDLWTQLLPGIEMAKTSIRFLTIRKFWNSMTHTKTILPLTMFTPS